MVSLKQLELITAEDVHLPECMCHFIIVNEF